MSRIARTRHLRHRRFGRVRHSDHLLAFLSQEATDLNGTGAADTFTMAARVTATGVLTFTGLAIADETVTIGSQVYTWKAAIGDTANEVLIGASAADCITNLVAAINGAAGNGTLYGALTDANVDVTAADGAGDTIDLTAIPAGALGNAVATTETLTNGSFGAATLTGGVDGDTLNAVAHGLAVGDGPFLLSSTTALPAGLSTTEQYWVAEVVDADNFKLTTDRDNLTSPAFCTDTGTGTHTLTVNDTAEAIFEIMKEKGVKPATIAAATDVDNL